MAKDFKALVRLNDWEVDQKRRALAEELRRLENLQALLQRLEEEILAEQEHAKTAPIEGGLTYGAYAEQAIRRRENYRERIAEQQNEVAAAREQLRLAFLEFKKFEITEVRRVAAVAAELNRTEDLDLNEVAITQYNRKT